MERASARKRTKVNPPKEKRNSSATVQQKQMDQRKLPDSTSLRTIWQGQSSAFWMERKSSTLSGGNGKKELDQGRIILIHGK